MFPFHVLLPVVAGEVENADSADDLFTSSLNLTVICVAGETLVPVGEFPVTFGGVRSCSIVVNCHTDGEAIVLSARSFAPIPIVTLKVVRYARFEAGV